MGFGGGSGQIKAQMEQQRMQNMAAEAALRESQGQLAAKQKESDAAAQARVLEQFADAQGQTKKAQAAAQLGILDYIKTGPSGLQNRPKSGKLTLLGN